MEKFLAAVRNMFQVPDLRQRILFTLGILAIYRLGAHVSAPGINTERLKQVWGNVSGTLLGVLDLFSGGNFRVISVFALGVTPYITSSIILQLMTVVSPKLKKLQEEGEMGRQKINQWTRYLTVALAGLQTSFVAHWLQVNQVGPRFGEPGGLGFFLTTVLTLTTGTIFVMWLGEQITERGVGNGISLLIFAGIVIGLPRGVQQVMTRVSGGDTMEIVGVLAMVVALVAIIAFIVFVEEVSDNLRKHGGFMPGIRPGRATAEYLNTILTRLTFVGAIYLAMVAFFPQFMLSGFKVARLPFIGTWLESFVSTTPGLGWIPTGMGYQFYFGGTSLLILVGVAMDTVAQIEAQLVMRNYEGFLGGGGRLRGRRA